MHSRLPARAILLVPVVALAVFFAALVWTPSPANATPDKQTDCSMCHGSGYTATVTATPSTQYPAPSAVYSVGITISQNTAGIAGYWIANSTAAGGTGTSTSVYAGPADQNVWTASRTAPATEGRYYYKVFGQDGPRGSGGQTGYALYSIAVDKTAPVTTDNHDTATHVSFTLSLSPTDAVSGVALTEYRIDGGSWKTGSGIRLVTERRHKGAGLSAGAHTVEYRSTDAAGNVESTRSCQVTLGR
jgi:hypothetical protein